MMMIATFILTLTSLLGTTHGYVPQPVETRAKISCSRNNNAFAGVRKAAAATFTAATIATISLSPIVEAADFAMPNVGSSNLISETVTRQGIYKEYDLDVGEQQVDNAKSTFKSKTQTKSKKGKYVALLSVLVFGSFIIPMAQYFWYVRDDDSSDRFFGKVPDPEPEPEPKKKGWFGK